MKKLFRSSKSENLFNGQISRLLTCLKSKGSKKNPVDKNRLSSRHLKLESLEDRVLLAVTNPSSIEYNAALVSSDLTLNDDPVDVVVTAATQTALQDAINLAGTEGYTSKVTFADNLKGQTINLSSVLTINKSVTIDASAIANDNGTPGITIRTTTSNLRYVLRFNGGSNVSTLDSIQISGNSTGLYNSGSTVHVNNSLFLSCSASDGPGAISNTGTMTINNTDIFRNTGLEGGGIQNSGTMSIDNSQISGNHADGGGGIHNLGNLRISNSIVSGNTATNGAGIYTSNSLSIYNVTIAGNLANSGQAPGVRVNSGAFNAYNSLILNNYINGTELNVVGNINNYNSMTSGAAGFQTAPSWRVWSATAYQSWDFHLIDGFSAAVNSGNNANAITTAGEAIAYDYAGQRRIYGDIVDMGAYEFPNDAPTDIILTYSNAANDFTYAYLNSGMTVGFFEAVDNDGYANNAPFSYALVDGDGATDNTKFALDGNTLKSTAILSDGFYSIRVQTADSWGLAYQKVFSIEAKVVKGVIVTTISDVSDDADGEVTLREAIAYAGTALDDYNTLGYDITFASDRNLYSKTITLTQGELVIDKSLTIKSENYIYVSGNDSSRVFNVSGAVDTETGEVAPITVSFKYLFIRNGVANADNGLNGGGMYINSAVTAEFNYVRFWNNKADDGQGGGVYINEGANVVFDRYNTFYENSAIDGAALATTGSTVVDATNVLRDNIATGNGGGIYVNGGTLELGTRVSAGTASVYNNIAENGGGIYVENAILSADRLTVYNNVASGNGGGLYAAVTDSGDYTFKIGGFRTSFYNNSAEYGGAILFDGGTSTITDTNRYYETAFYNNDASVAGGAIAVLAGTHSFNRFNIYQNSAVETGGAIYNAANITLINSALRENDAALGAGFYNNGGEATILNSTLAANQGDIGAGLYTADGTVTLANSIVAFNNAATSCADVYTADVSTAETTATYSLVQTDYADGDPGKAFTKDAKTLVGVDPLFAETEVGEVFNINLTFASPAQGGGSNTLGQPAMNYAFNGVWRRSGYRIDIGATEYVLKPDLVYNTPEGWAAPVTLSNVEDDFSNAVTTFTATEPIYVSASFQNQAEVNATTAFQVTAELCVNGQPINLAWSSVTMDVPSLNSKTVLSIANQMHQFPAGTYSLRITLNSSGSLVEENAENNVYETAEFVVVAEQLATPANVTASMSSNEATIGWDAVANADSYTLQISETADFATVTEYTFTEAGSHLLSETFILPNYYIRVKATVEAEGVFYTASEFATYDFATGIPLAPSDITFTDYDAVAKTVRLNWVDNSDNEAGFRIDYSIDGGVNWLISKYMKANDTYRDCTGISPNVNYMYRVRAYNDSGASDWAVGTLVNVVTPAAPSDVIFDGYNPATRTVEMSWTLNSLNETGVRVEYSVDNGATWKLSKNYAAGTTSRTCTAIAANSTYNFRVQVYNTAGASDWAYGTFTTAIVPDAPENLVLSGYDSMAKTLEMTWEDKSFNETGFRIEYRIDGGAWRLSQNMKANTVSRTCTGLTPDKDYEFRVRAYNATGASDWISASFSTKIAPLAPSDVTFENYDAAAKTVVMKWVDNSGNEKGFYVEYSKDGGTSWKRAEYVKAGVTERVCSGIDANTTYMFRVQAYNGSGASDWAVGTFDPSAAQMAAFDSLFAEEDDDLFGVYFA